MSTQSDSSYASLGVVVPVVAGAPPVRRFTVEEYHRMIEAGILSENDRVELLDGWILEMSPIGPPRRTCVSVLQAVLQTIVPAGWSVLAQGPITLATGEPEPDLTVVHGGLRDYLDRHPGPSDIALVVEVADTSLEYDRREKRAQYALAGIPEYWIVNLIDRQLEIYRDLAAGGDDMSPVVIDDSGSVALTIAGKVEGTLRVADVLP